MAKRTNFDRSRGEDMDAKRVREFADEIAKKTAELTALLYEAAKYMDRAEAGKTINAQVSQFGPIIEGLQDRARKQLRNKAWSLAELATSQANERKSS